MNVRPEPSTFSSIRVRRLTPQLGAEVSGIDLSQELGHHVVAELRAAILRYKVIVIRDQDITTAQHVAFSRRLGRPDIHPSAPADQPFPEVLYLRNGPDSKAPADMWHTDGSWRAEPSWATILRAKTLPETGGDTLFADMGAAYESLSPALKGWLATLTGVHDISLGFAGKGAMSREELTAKFPTQEHPVIVTHPETGERLLYVNFAFASSIKDLSQEESDWLLRHLFAQATVPEFQFRLHWEPNTVAIWDNWSVQHYANFDYHPAIREMERVAVANDLSFHQTAVGRFIEERG